VAGPEQLHTDHVAVVIDVDVLSVAEVQGIDGPVQASPPSGVTSVKRTWAASTSGS
jgi:hypothetical protein